ncbi:Holliday junction branch migration DNA helicase RuvB [Neoehrlichia mikurensis]|uniref:Holliday junction branch migration complex subunit RuvB n=1 Tax=Neoehrlichia mikurensis TaxID=89586 RepID=A0A9Q9BVA5_9RICK|nr:Holliday junction branch migration DNA helicase RuvB [Neoehrlichia mikurensis]QXK91728.1 Holliday junction branch migration DNA helicase RuvB [Neoehrlichia mikurensis]QXK92940.1 Holliday junction branch migration DNA helicase RuvB [Neoehrlichia mikurensis]QXK93418.1 Holliday junction branch migration DNA helicase RuvB [Neoehrlichia mikurensis]UTO55631.1 Holliday junction branch migration DNA helicase RuvB [Neoehrlichia mikurensis]UTO56552.1 Holliday junction branch migration DNA helicase Ru
MLQSHESEEDKRNTSLRPNLLKEFIGQSEIVSNLKVFIDAAYARKEQMDHILLYGPPGLGKTTLAHITAKELKVNFRSTAGPLLNKAGDLAAILTNLQPKDVLFIDEIHRLNRNIEEILYPAMEDYCLDIVIGEGCGARTLKIDLPVFTLIGATTRFGLLSSPLRDRFGIPLHLEFYSIEELILVIIRAAKVINTNIDNDGAREIALRSRGTPRIALRLLRRLRDFLEVKGYNIIDRSFVNQILSKLGINNIGLDKLDISYLKFIFHSNGAVGLETIAAALSEDINNIEETIEPYLIKINFLQRTPRGRIITPQAIQYLTDNLLV